MPLPRSTSTSPARTPLVWALVLASGSAAVQAQNLSEVVDAARGYDATYLGARSNADAARYRYEQTLALHRPSANLAVQLQRTDSHTPYAVAEGGLAATKSDIGTATVSAQQTLFNRQNSLQIDEAQKAVDASQSQVAQAEQDLIVRVAQAYFNVLAAADALHTVQANSKAIAEQLASAKRNFEVGNATITDTREAAARFDLARSQEISAENDLQVSHVTLDQLVGRNGIVPHPLALPAALPPVMPAQASEWVALTESNNPVLKQAQLNRDIAELETGRAKAGHLPTLAAGAQYVKNYEHDRFSAPRIEGFDSGWGSNASVSVTLTVPLFSGGAIQNRLRETVALQEKARSDAEGAHNNATLSTRQAFLGAESLSAQVRALEAAEASSQLALDATKLGYKVGVKVNLDVLNAQSQLFTTERDLATARYNYMLATLKLRQAAGILTTNDLLAVDALLVGAAPPAAAARAP
ncbi:MAG: TolC family outer membrane protein, partial [Burkholderiaceae bacterium]